MELRNGRASFIGSGAGTARKLPASVYRCKGVVHTAEEPGRRVILQVVGKRVDIAVGDEWNGWEPLTRIIAIGAHDGLDGAALREVFYSCRDAMPHQAKTNASRADESWPMDQPIK